MPRPLGRAAERKCLRHEGTTRITTRTRSGVRHSTQIPPSVSTLSSDYWFTVTTASVTLHSFRDNFRMPFSDDRSWTRCTHARRWSFKDRSERIWTNAPNGSTTRTCARYDWMQGERRSLRDSPLTTAISCRAIHLRTTTTTSSTTTTDDEVSRARKRQDSGTAAVTVIVALL